MLCEKLDIEEHGWVRERCRLSVWKWSQKKNEKGRTVITWCSILRWQKAHNNARPPDTAELRWKAILSALYLCPTFGCFKPDCPQTDIVTEALLNHLEHVLVSFIWKNVPTLGLLRMGSWGCCDNTFRCRTSLHAAYPQPIAGVPTWGTCYL